MAVATGSIHRSLLFALLLACVSASAHSQAAARNSPLQARDIKPAGGQARVRTDIDSFHLDRQPAPPHTAIGAVTSAMPRNTPSQIGAASRGSDSVLALCAPHAGLASSPRPVFVWQLPPASAAALHFSLVTPGGDVLFEADVTGDRLEYPEDAPPLTPGDTFGWTVSGHGGMDKLPTYVQFQVQPRPDRETLLKQLAAAPADPLARAQIFLTQGVWYDAVAELGKGIALNPARQDLTQQLHELYRQVSPTCTTP